MMFNTIPAYVLGMLVAVAFISLGISNAAGKVAAAESTIDSDKAMRFLRGNRWYNSEEQAYKPPVLAKPVDDSIRRNGWEAQPSSWMWDWDWSWPSFGSGFGGWGISADAMGWVLLSVLGTALIGGIIAVLYFYLRDSLPFQKRAANRSKPLKIDPMKVEDLPFEVREQSGDPLRDAEYLMRAGRYNEAVVYLYGYMLLALDHARKIHLQKGKTNRMYLRELRSQAVLKSIVNRTMLAFEDVFFGRYDIDAARFTDLWAQFKEFHGIVQPASPNALNTVGEVATL